MDVSPNGLAHSNPLTMSQRLPTSSDEWLDLWHQHRDIIIVAVAVVLMLVRLYLHFNEPAEGLVAIPKVLEKKKTSAPEPIEIKAPVSVPVSSVLPTTAAKTIKRGPKRIVGTRAKGSPKSASPSRATSTTVSDPRTIQPLVFFSSVTTNTQRIVGEFLPELTAAISAQKLGESAPHVTVAAPMLLDLAEIDFDDYFVAPPPAHASSELLYLFLLPSYNIDTINDAFLQHLQETHYDFRIDTAALTGLAGFSVFGFGDREGWKDEAEGFCFQATELDRWMAKLTGGKRAYPVGMGDTKVDYKERLAEWTTGIADVVGMIATTGGLGEGLFGSGNADESDAEEASADEDDEVYVEGDQQQQQQQQQQQKKKKKKKEKKSLGDFDDIENLGRIAKAAAAAAAAAADNATEANDAEIKAPIAIDFTTYGKDSFPLKRPVQAAKEMVPVNSPTYKSLTKQGYSIVGSHSGVKICRWTKSALRGRGSCYKYSFYGINSHQCMESTPSLSCSNKCVFCWRHGTNPVGTTWRWVVDPPELIFKGIKEQHYKKINVLKGMAGVRAERYAEALRIRHCALSLVGEPIFYPYINEFLSMLHKEHISSFLVCNAQHPNQLAALKAVTQLYVSIDAADRESLRRIDRPLHRDFWERFQKCLQILREKRMKHRTVFRLTLVKGFNLDEEVDGYARLVEQALPCFVEIKGVTYCGTSTAANAGLRMQNVPFYWEVCEFVRSLDKKLKEKGLDYGIAAEHAHSCCILMGSGRFRVDGKWHTQIDYERFFQLVEERGADGEWTAEEYMGLETPEWATWGNGGFDPRDQRVDRKGRPIEGNKVEYTAPGTRTE